MQKNEFLMKWNLKLQSDWKAVECLSFDIIVVVVYTGSTYEIRHRQELFRAAEEGGGFYHTGQEDGRILPCRELQGERSVRDGYRQVHRLIPVGILFYSPASNSAIICFSSWSEMFSISDLS